MVTNIFVRKKVNYFKRGKVNFFNKELTKNEDKWVNNKSLSNIHDWKERRLGGEKKEATRCYKSIALQDVTKKSNQSLQYSNDNIQKKYTIT